MFWTEVETIINVAAKGIITFDNKTLIIQRSDYSFFSAYEWECPGGRIEFGEDIKTALLREIKEETGLSVKINEIAYAGSFMLTEHVQVYILAYMCSADNGTVTLSSEHKNYLWASKEQMREMLSKPIIEDFDRNSIWDKIP